MIIIVLSFAKVKVTKDFQSWHETLCAEFPTRFNRFRGPMWSGLPQSEQRNPLKVSLRHIFLSSVVITLKTLHFLCTLVITRFAF